MKVAGRFAHAADSKIALFVRRPILAFVLNALIVLAGIAGLMGAEIRELPNVDRPVVTITTPFPGASPETVDQDLTGRIEGAVGRVSGVRSISSNSRYARSRVTVEFEESVDIDVAATDIRDAVGRIVNDLPDEAETPQIVKADANADPIMRIAVTSSGRSPQELTRIVRDRVEDQLISIPGVADLQVYGDREPVFRVDIDLLELAGRGLTLADLRNALADAAFDAPAGDLSGSRQSINVRTTATVATPEAFEALKIARDVRLGDVSQVTLGPAPNETVLRANGRMGLGMGVIRQATSNTLEISRAVHAVVAELNRTLPEDIEVFVTSDDAVFIQGSIDEVLKTLALAVLIVVAVIFVFLRDLRATAIPAITLPVALIGTLAAIWLVGFSVNILTLLALVLATGMVVDDAIVVLENIVRLRMTGMGPRAAAVLGTQQVFFAVVTTTATLVAVFVPLSFLPGQAGGLFREFGFTLALAVALSSVVALTLCPMLASRLLRAHDDSPPPRGPMVWLGARLAALYAVTLRGALCGAAGGGAGRHALRGDRRLSRRRHPAGADPARGPGGGAAQGHRAARGLAGLYRFQDARDRGGGAAAARKRRDHQRLLDHRLRGQEQRLHGVHPVEMGRAHPLAAGDSRRDEREVRRDHRRARLHHPA